MAMIDEGAAAPTFTLEDQDGAAHSVPDPDGRPVVLFFYPKDMTPGCTLEACDFRDLADRFDEAGVAVFGVSILDTKSKAKFAAKHDIAFPLLADAREDADGKPDPEVANAYGVWVEKSMYGKTYMGIQRTTYLIGTDGTVHRRWDKVKVKGHAEEVLDAARALV